MYFSMPEIRYTLRFQAVSASKETIRIPEVDNESAERAALLELLKNVQEGHKKSHNSCILLFLLSSANSRAV